ncbi:hypothetical protein [Calothrix sp. NIES-2100]|uniref:hypothetical protein n=1 Tax=Calothrix sp. NIES-2100 TaxID=1954172 RepID=UPI000BBC9237
MSEKTLEGSGKAFLVLLLPISFLIIFLVTTWKFLLALMLLLMGFNIWQWQQWQNWSRQVNPVFHRLVMDNQGRVTPMDLAIKGNFSGTIAKRYLDTKASEFGASILNSEDGSPVYYFINATILGSILESSDPVKELPAKSFVQTAPVLLAPTLPQPQPEETEAELLPTATHEEVKIPLEKQLVFGSLIQSELAKRLNVYSSTVYKRRNDPDFPEWSRSRDPDGIAWSFSRRNKEFFPLEEKDKS